MNPNTPTPSQHAMQISNWPMAGHDVNTANRPCWTHPQIVAPDGPTVFYCFILRSTCNYTVEHMLFFWLPFPFPGSEDRVHLLKRALEAISWRSIEGPSQVKAGAKLTFMLRPWYAYWGGGEVACRVMNASQGLVQDRRTTQVAGRPGRPGQPVAGGRLHQPLARIGHGFHPGGGGRAALQHRSTSSPELHRQVLGELLSCAGRLANGCTQRANALPFAPARNYCRDGDMKRIEAAMPKRE